MIVKTTLNINKQQREKLEAKYPDITFTRLVEMGLDKLLVEDPTEAPTTENEQLKLLIQDYNKLKTSYRQFKDEIDNRIIILETRLG